MRTLTKPLTMLLLAVAAFCGNVYAALPLVDQFQVQAFLQKADGTAVTETTGNFTVTVEINSVAVWGKSFTSVPVTAGLLSLTLNSSGSALPASGPCAAQAGAFGAVTLNPALLVTNAATSGEIAVHICSTSTFNTHNLDFNVTLGAVPTAYLADTATKVVNNAITLAMLNSADYVSTFGSTADSGKLVAVAASGKIDPTLIPPLDASAISTSQVGIGNGGTGSNNGSVSGTGSVVYQSTTGTVTVASAATFATTVGNATSSSSAVIQSGSGGVNVTSTSGNIILNPGSGLVRVTNGNGIDLVNGSGSITVNAPSNPTSYTLLLPGTAGANHNVLSTDGTGNTSWSMVDLTNAITGILPVANGGTGNGSLSVAAGGVIYSDGSVLQNTGAGTSGFILKSAGAGAPVWSSLSSAGVAASPNNTDLTILNAAAALTLGGGSATSVSIIPSGLVTLAGTTGVSIVPAGAVAISPTAGGLVLNPSASLQLGGTSTTSTVMSPSGTVTVNPTGVLTLGGSSTVFSNGFVMTGSTSGALTVSAPATPNYGIKLPNAQGGSGQSLINDGSGNLSWGAVAVSGSNTDISQLNPAGTLTVTGASQIFNPSGIMVINPTGALSLGGAATTAISTGSSTGLLSLDLGSAATGALTTTLGSSAAASVTNIQSGTGGITISSTGTGAGAITLKVTGAGGGITFSPNATGKLTLPASTVLPRAARYWSLDSVIGANAAASVTSVGYPTAATVVSSGAGVFANADGANGPFLNAGTLAVIENVVGWGSTNANSLVQSRWNPIYTARISTTGTAGDMTNSRLYLGFSSYTTLNTIGGANNCLQGTGAAVSLASKDSTGAAGIKVQNVALFRWANGTSNDANTKWQCVTCDGAACTTTDSGVTVTTGSATPYDMEIDLTSANAVFKINGTTVCTNTTNLPTSTAAMAAVGNMCTGQAVTAKKILFSRQAVTF